VVSRLTEGGAKIGRDVVDGGARLYAIGILNPGANL
jgi:hypothetical protein